MTKTKQISQDCILKELQLTTLGKVSGELTREKFILKFDDKKSQNKIVVDRNEIAKLADVVNKDFAGNENLTEIMIEAMQEIIKQDPKQALRDIPLAFLEIQEIQDCLDQNLGKLYTEEFIKVFGINAKEEKVKQQVDQVRRDIFESYKKMEDYQPDQKFTESVMANIEKANNKVSAKTLFASVSGTQAYNSLMTEQVADKCCLNARLYTLCRNRDQEAEKQIKEENQVQ